MAELIYAGDAGLFKTCSRCKELKSEQCFGVRPERSFSFRPKCHDCEKEISKEKRLANPTAAREYAAKKKASDPDYFNEVSRRYRARNPNKVAELNEKTRLARSSVREEYRAAERVRYYENREHILKRKADWRARNLDKRRAYEAERRASNREVYREQVRRQNAKRAESPVFRLENAVRTGFHKGLTKGSKAGRKTFDLLGYRSHELRAHLERQFSDGMSWENYGKGGWEVDHITPLSAFNYQTPDDFDFKRAWALSNLRPMWFSDNRTKGAKLKSDFQPSLAF